MLTDATLEHILSRIPTLRMGVVGDLFLDRYLEIDASLTEPSLETGLDAYQVARVRSQPGAAGTVINNLVALGVGCIHVIAVIGDDGEGYELRQALKSQRGVDSTSVFPWDSRRTPTYTKPMLHEAGRPPRELNRLDIKNHSAMPSGAEDRIMASLDAMWPRVDALLVLDQVSEPECGVVTTRVRKRLAELGEANPKKLILADSREHIGLFRAVSAKPNQRECSRAVGGVANPEIELARRTGRPVFCTAGDHGIVLADPRGADVKSNRIPAYPVSGPTDVVGAGDSTSAAIACAVAAGATLEDVAAFGNLVASITIQQLGTTGTATPDQVRQRWQVVCGVACFRRPP
jgi:bifunctional ADP-heptose synthase (sugar kinase/adenylyltransferase)